MNRRHELYTALRNHRPIVRRRPDPVGMVIACLLGGAIAIVMFGLVRAICWVIEVIA